MGHCFANHKLIYKPLDTPATDRDGYVISHHEGMWCNDCRPTLRVRMLTFPVLNDTVLNDTVPDDELCWTMDCAA